MSQSDATGVRGTRSVALAGAMVALSGFLVQAVASRPLDDADLAQFLAFWAMAFTVMGIVGGVQHEVTRGTAAHEERPVEGGARVVPLTVGVGLGAAVLVVATAPSWSSSVVPVHPSLGVALVAFAALFFSGHGALLGVLAGRGEWLVYSRVMAAEAIVRLALIGVVILVGAPLVGYEIATAVATATWVAALVVSRTVRRAWKQQSDVGVQQFVRGASHTLLASASTAVLVVGFPVLIGITSSGPEFTGAAALILALSLTRAPLLLPLNAFQGVAIRYFVQAGVRRFVALSRLIALVVSVGLVGSVLAYLVGPWLLWAITGRELGGCTLAALTLASTVLAVLTLTGTVALAMGLHRAYSAGWALTALVAFALLFLPADLESRVLTSLCLAPATGILVHVTALQSGRTQQWKEVASDYGD